MNAKHPLELHSRVARADGKASAQLFRCVWVTQRCRSFDAIMLFTLLCILLFVLLFTLLLKVLFNVLLIKNT